MTRCTVGGCRGAGTERDGVCLFHAHRAPRASHAAWVGFVRCRECGAITQDIASHRAQTLLHGEDSP